MNRFGLMVPETGVEPVRSCLHRILSPGRLPVPPLGQIKKPTLFTEITVATWGLLEAPPGFEPGVRALQAPALPLGYGATLSVYAGYTKAVHNGAEDEIRTRDICLGKATLYH